MGTKYQNLLIQIINKINNNFVILAMDPNQPEQPHNNNNNNKPEPDNQSSSVHQASENIASNNAENNSEDEWQSLNHDEDDDDDYDDDEDKDHHQLSQSKPQPEEEEQTLGCQHYLRNCEVEAPCCKIYYVCKLCHDDKYQGPKANWCKIERMSFCDVANVRCLKCSTVQPPSLKCINADCEILFGKYACLKCKLYENRSSKVNDIFHCDDCKMCRRGKVQNFFHCHKCGYCRAISQKDKHKCTENLAESQCPICLEVLKYSTKHYMALPCGHLIHLKCLEGYRDINCPVCGMATQKFSAAQNLQMDHMIEQTRANMPKELLEKKVDILCNECLHKSLQQPFHFLGIKCQGCGTYNTKMI